MVLTLTQTPKTVGLTHTSNELNNKIHNIVCELDLKLSDNGKYLTGPCPIHGGDNITAFSLNYRNGGNWRCYTKHCEDVFKSSIIGFVRGYFSHEKLGWRRRGDKTLSFKDTLKICNKFVNKNYGEGAILNQSIPYKEPVQNIAVSIESFLRKIKVPSNFFLRKGFSKDILQKYHIGDCFERGKKMYLRAVAPIFNNDHSLIIGVTGRSFFEKCSKCKMHHHPAAKCPEKYHAIYSKWRNANIEVAKSLYNWWFAQEYIKKLGWAVLVEGPADVWYLEERGVHNAVALYRNFITREQINMLAGITENLLLLMDNDAGGEEGVAKIHRDAGNYFKIRSARYQKNESLKKLSIGRLYELCSW